LLSTRTRYNRYKSIFKKFFTFIVKKSKYRKESSQKFIYDSTDIQNLTFLYSIAFFFKKSWKLTLQISLKIPESSLKFSFRIFSFFSFIEKYKSKLKSFGMTTKTKYIWFKLFYFSISSQNSTHLVQYFSNFLIFFEILKIDIYDLYCLSWKERSNDESNFHLWPQNAAWNSLNFFLNIFKQFEIWIQFEISNTFLHWIEQMRYSACRKFF